MGRYYMCFIVVNISVNLTETCRGWKQGINDDLTFTGVINVDTFFVLNEVELR